MELVRLYISQDTDRRVIDVPLALVAEAQIEIEMGGGTVYHISRLSKPPKVRWARLNRRLY